MRQINYFHQPNISESFGNGWYTMKKYFLPLLLAVIVSGMISSGSQYSFSDKNSGDWSWSHNFFNYNMPEHFFMAGWILVAVLLGITLVLFISPVFSYGSTMMFIQGIRDERPEPRWLIEGFRTHYFNIVLANLITSAVIIMGCIALLIPGIIIACRLIFVSNFVMDKQLDPIKAIEASWRLTRGYGWTVFGLGFLSIFIFILGLICLFVGVFPAIIWIRASFASLYQAILTEKGLLFEQEYLR